jgi:3-phenylpropionate/cinnamic acid dioxygenase small subunit
MDEGSAATGPRLEDRAAIADQMFRYARATDWLQTAMHREVFVDDCVFASPHSGDMHGVDAVVAWMDRALASFEATQHLIGTIAITFTGADTADAVSYVRAWHRYRDRTRADLVLWGEYHDRWRRVDGTWRIAERRVLEAGIEPRREGGAPNPRRALG